MWLIRYLPAACLTAAVCSVQSASIQYLVKLSMSSYFQSNLIDFIIQLLLKLRLQSNIIKNPSSFTSHKKTPSFRLYLILAFFSITFIYEPFLMKNYINANSIKRQIIVSWIKGHWRSHKVTFIFKIHFLTDIFFSFKSDLIETLYIGLLTL